MNGPDTHPIVSVRGLSKTYGGAHALREVSLDIHAGQVHGLVGANGAGKSTFIRCLAGVVHPDAGEISVDGRPEVIDSAHRADQLGLAFIHQELSLVPRFDTMQNLLLGMKRLGTVGLGRSGEARQSALAVAKSLGFTFRLDVPVRELSVADQWMISIGRALVRKARVIAMDEPTASLSQTEVDRLFAVTRDLTRNGIAVLYVSHRLPEILELCDEVSVFRNGAKTVHLAKERINKSSLFAGITGSDGADDPTYGTAVPAEGEPDPGEAPPPLELRGLTTAAVRDVSLTVYRGEVVGLAGLVGSGRTEVARAVFGLDQVIGGAIYRDGRPIRLRRPIDALRHGIGLVPEERRAEALLLTRPIHVNLNLATLNRLRLRRWLPLTNRRKAVRTAQRICGRLLVKFGSMSDPVGSLSGGNQQKVVIGRWMSRGSDVLILDELSRGVDIGARAEIHGLLRDYAAEGHAVLAISSEPEELVGFCDRIYVMHERTISGELARGQASEEAIVALSYGDWPRDERQEATCESK